MSDKTTFPCAYPNYQEARIDTTFWDDLTIAERFGFEAVKDTYKRAFENWKDNIKYLVELCGMVNHKSWYWHGVNNELSKWYADKYYEVRDYVYGCDSNGPSKFTDDELKFFTWVLD